MFLHWDGRQTWKNPQSFQNNKQETPFTYIVEDKHQYQRSTSDLHTCTWAYTHEHAQTQFNIHALYTHIQHTHASYICIHTSYTHKHISFKNYNVYIICIMPNTHIYTNTSYTGTIHTITSYIYIIHTPYIHGHIYTYTWMHTQKHTNVRDHATLLRNKCSMW